MIKTSIPDSYTCKVSKLIVSVKNVIIYAVQREADKRYVRDNDKFYENPWIMTLKPEQRQWRQSGKGTP